MSDEFCVHENRYLLEQSLKVSFERAIKAGSMVEQLIELWNRYRNPDGRSQTEISEKQRDIGKDVDVLIDKWQKQMEAEMKRRLDRWTKV